MPISRNSATESNSTSSSTSQTTIRSATNSATNSTSASSTISKSLTRNSQTNSSTTSTSSSTSSSSSSSSASSTVARTEGRFSRSFSFNNSANSSASRAASARIGGGFFGAGGYGGFGIGGFQQFLPLILGATQGFLGGMQGCGTCGSGTGGFGIGNTAQSRVGGSLGQRVNQQMHRVRDKYNGGIYNYDAPAVKMTASLLESFGTKSNFQKASDRNSYKIEGKKIVKAPFNPPETSLSVFNNNIQSFRELGQGAIADAMQRVLKENTEYSEQYGQFKIGLGTATRESRNLYFQAGNESFRNLVQEGSELTSAVVDLNNQLKEAGYQNLNPADLARNKYIQENGQLKLDEVIRTGTTIKLEDGQKYNLQESDRSLERRLGQALSMNFEEISPEINQIELPNIEIA